MPNQRPPHPTLRYVLVGAWLVFTISLTTWWYIFSLTQLERLRVLAAVQSPEFIRNRHMLTWEGAVLIACLVLGGLGLMYLIYRDQKRNQKMREFLRTFSHELKTPIGSLRLQAESLAADLGESPHRELVSRVVADTTRLTHQLENSLVLADLEHYQPFIENVDVGDVVERIRHQWPNVGIAVSKQTKVKADRRALDSILQNLVQNSVVHGHATDIQIEARPGQKEQIDLHIRDNGKGFVGDPNKLAEQFVRHYSGSGNGIGLFVSRRLANLMNGSLKFNPAPHSFEVILTLQKADG